MEIWAKKKGLELAASCHLARITQAALLLQARKGSAEDIVTFVHNSSFHSFFDGTKKETLNEFGPVTTVQRHQFSEWRQS